jgi:hypothetical protein
MSIGINLTRQRINLGEHAVAQVYLLSESIREGLGWKIYREK